MYSDCSLIPAGNKWEMQVSRQHSHVPPNNAGLTLKLFALNCFSFPAKGAIEIYNTFLTSPKWENLIILIFCGDVRKLEMMSAVETFLAFGISSVVLISNV